MATFYRSRRVEFERRKVWAERRANRTSHARVGAFLATVVCFLAGMLDASSNIPWFAAGAILSAVFFSLVWLYERLRTESTQLEQLGSINRQAVARVLREWESVPLRSARIHPGEEILSDDLDLFGKASLFHLVCQANTPMGIDRLAQWFLHPADPATMVRRQQAVAELAPRLDHCQELHRRGLALAQHKTDPARFLHWAEGEPWLARRRWLKWTSRCVPLLTLIGISLWLVDAAPLSAWLAPLLINMAIAAVYCRQVHPIFQSISSRHGELGHYADLLQLIAETPVKCDCLRRLQQEAVADGVSACREMRWLTEIMGLANLRFSAIHVLVQWSTSWDFHLLSLLERWQRRNGSCVRQWLELVAEWESLASLASLAHDNPNWVYPTIEERSGKPKRLAARSLGHPLISDRRRVANDVTLGPPGKVLLVTGSNMSGKSTLLRAIGVNVVLAQAGAPVCADEFKLPPVRLATSMRVHDSLCEGVSYYMAELKRIKQIVDAACAREAASGGILLYLLDEILRGTNSAERQIAVRHVLASLLAKGAIGAISTHDLELATIPPLSDACRAVHFRETIHNDSGYHQMSFDYRLHEGVATTANALKLLEMIGLNER